jgi:ATP-binding cassette, subfamily B, bacterial
MRTASRPAKGPQGADPDAAGASPFEPMATTARYRAPAATIDPDREKTWLRRAMPIVLSHKRMFITSLVMSFLALVLQVQIPKLLEEAINNSLVARTVPLSHYVRIVFVLAVIAGIAGYISRYFLMRTAY